MVIELLVWLSKPVVCLLGYCLVIELLLVNMAFLANVPFSVTHFRFQDMSFSPFYVHNFVMQHLITETK